MKRAPKPYECHSQFHTFLNGAIPDTAYPYAGAYGFKSFLPNPNQDKEFFDDSMSMDRTDRYPFPYTVRRHRVPQVFMNPKPTKFFNAATGYKYQIPQYPNFLYWYPGDTLCSDVCGEKICNKYYNDLNNYRNCQRCQMKDPPQCWSPKMQTCVDCPRHIALGACQSRERYGCGGNTWPMADTEPQNPMLTGCRNCRN